MGVPAIQMTDISFAYRQASPLLQDVSLCVDQGAFTALLGPNGAGKSTLLRLLSGWYKPDSGTIELLGQNIRSISRRSLARQLAIVEQIQSYSTDITVRELIALGRLPHQGLLGGASPADNSAVEKALQQGGLQDMAQRPLSQLSGGERQRARLAMALAQEAPVLALDEPTTHLDIRHQLELLTLLSELQQHGLTVLSVLHDINLAALFCDKLILLKEGRVLTSGSVNDVLTEENIEQLYDCKAVIYPHPLYGLPQVALAR